MVRMKDLFMKPQSIGYLFPGQGAQVIGMGKDLCDSFPEAKKVFKDADSLLGYSLQKIAFEGPDEELTRTRYAQPAIFVTSMATLAVLNHKFPDIKPTWVAGLSLGEFSALVAAQAISYEEGLQLVKKRAEAMEKCAKNHSGTMASVLGLTVEECEVVAKDAGCQVANINSPNQIVLSGSVESIQKACDVASAKGAKRVIPLKVGGAFHSELMKEAQDDLEKALQEISRVSKKNSYIVVESYRNEQEKTNLLYWQLTCECLYTPEEWEWIFKKFGYTGDYSFIFFE